MKSSRRTFLKVSTSAVAGSLLPLQAFSAPKSGAVDRLRVAIIGAGIRSNTLGPLFAKHPGTRVTHICDADISRAQEIAAKVGTLQNETPAAIQDLRRIMDNDDIDVVVVCTCNHWHVLAAIWAMQAGKDVYCEKPLSWCISEGRRIIEASRKYDRICQVGTQYRSDGTAHAAKALIDEGAIGEVKLIRSVTYGERQSIGPKVEGKIPKTCDYNLWAGPAPMSPITRERFDYNWHWFWETGNGELCNNDVHRADLALWAINRHKPATSSMSFGGRFVFNDCAETPNSLIALHDHDGITHIQEVRNLPSDKFYMEGSSFVFGTEGIMSLWANSSALLDLDGKLVRKIEGNGGNSNQLVARHVDNFIKAVKSRKRDDQCGEVAQGHVSAAVCHSANNSYRLGKPADLKTIQDQVASRDLNGNIPEVLDQFMAHLKKNDVALKDVTLGPWLDFDHQKEQYIDNPVADALLTREYREPFVVPKTV